MDDIQAEPEQSCGRIDAGIKDVSKAIKTLESASRDTEVKETEDDIDDALYDLSDIVDQFEYCRSQCEEIRAWGKAWKDTAEDLVEQVKALEETLDRMEA
jgi:predicted secreted protein|tara:strand:+ start:545 stop:844 length:300 start_codon:yes stop_codon:yes gene_type:complete